MWWRHQMETYSALLALCAGNSPVTGEYPSQRPVMRSFDIFFDLCLNKLLGKQLWDWWFETPPYSLGRHCNGSWFSIWCAESNMQLGAPVAHMASWSECYGRLVWNANVPLSALIGITSSGTCTESQNNSNQSIIISARRGSAFYISDHL